jgi:transcriptional regulator with PAS, ATPase and Fis domain
MERIGENIMKSSKSAIHTRHAARGVATSGNVELSALWLTEATRSKAIEMCRRAIRKANGSIEKAAKELGVGRRTLFRWAEQHPEIRKAS